MNTLDLDALQKFTRQAQKLQAIADELKPFLDSIRDLDGKFPPTDRLIRSGEAAQILGVNQSTISDFVKAGLLTPFYVNSDQRRFWLSQVRSLPRRKPWTLRSDFLE